MEYSNSDEQGGNTLPITTEFIQSNFSHIMRTLKDLPDWKNQQTLQVNLKL